MRVIFVRVRPAEVCQQAIAEQLCHMAVMSGNRAADPIVFVPELDVTGLRLPDRGLKVDADRLDKLSPLKVQRTAAPQGGAAVH